MEKVEKESLRNEIGDRLSEYLHAEGLTATALEKKGGFTPRSIYNVAIQKRFPGAETLIALKDYDPNLNLNWLIYGQGSKSLKGKKEGNAQPEIQGESIQRKVLKEEAEMWKMKYMDCLKATSTKKIR